MQASQLEEVRFEPRRPDERGEPAEFGEQCLLATLLENGNKIRVADSAVVLRLQVRGFTSRYDFAVAFVSFRFHIVLWLRPAFFSV